MPLRMWMLDIAREQSPTLDHLRLFCRTSLDAGYDALGLYFEHRFAYPSTPWAHGVGCVTPAMIRTLESEFPGLQLIPFVNLLGHFEGMIYTESGKRYAEEKFQGMQACPVDPEFVALAERLVDDTLACFGSEIVHIGGDETWQLGKGAKSAAQVEAYEAEGASDGKAELYGRHFGPLARRVLDAGRRPAVWGDMFLDHSTALDHMPDETLIFDWQYFKGLADTSPKFSDRGFDVVGCPAFHVYNATWMHLPETERNVREVHRDVEEMGLFGTCVTTWECGLFGAYDTLLPAVRAAGGVLHGDQSPFLQAYLKESERHEEWARLMGVELQTAGGTFAFGGIRSSLKVRLLLQANPFLAWLHHGEELSGEVGDKALDIIELALAVAPTEAEKGVTLFARSAIEFVRMAEVARQRYAVGRPGEAASALAPTRQLFDDLQKVAARSIDRIGGSRADVERCQVAKAAVERAIHRIKLYGDGSLGYLPAFEHLTHPKFMPHDQGAWWLINRWANQ